MPEPSRHLRPSERERLFAVAERSVRELREFIQGERELSAAEVEARKGFVRQASRESFYFFAKVVLGYDKMTNQTHKRWAEELQRKWLAVDYFMRLKPRGTFKTTLYGCAFILWAWAVFTPELRFFYTSANQTLLDEVSAELDRFVGEKAESVYALVFGIRRDAAAKKNTVDAFNITGRAASKGTSLILRTAGGATNGIHPHAIIVDDPCFAEGTPILTARGWVPVQNVSCNDLIWTRAGYRRVTWCGMTGISPVGTYSLNGRILRVTPNHGIVTANRGKVPIAELRDTDTIFELGSDGAWHERTADLQRLSSSTASPTAATPSPGTRRTAATSGRRERTGSTRAFIGQSGNTTTVQCLPDFTSTTATETTSTTSSRTSSSSTGACTTRSTPGSCEPGLESRPRLTSTEFVRSPRPTIRRTSGGSVSGKFGPRKGTSKRSACRADEPFAWRRECGIGPGTALERVRATLSTAAASITRPESASRAESNFDASATPSRSAARAGVEPDGGFVVEPVFNLTVEGEHQYVANGILVANCDASDRSSQAVREAKQRWYDSLHPLLVPLTWADGAGVRHTIRKIMFIATRWHLQDLPAYVMKKHGAKWDIEAEGVYLPDGSPRYPELLPETAIAQIREAISDVFFASQYLNEPLPEGAQIFSAARLHYLRPDQYDLRQGTTYCFFDPSQGKKGGDFPAAIWFNVLNGRNVVFWAIDKKVELAALLPMLAQYNREFRTRLLRYETNGTMGLDAELRRAHKDAGADTAIEGFHETRNKEERIYAMQPALYRGAWHFRADHADVYPELMNQLVYFPAWGHDDFPDVIEKAVTWVETNMPGDFHRNATKPSGTFAGSKSARAPW